MLLLNFRKKLSIILYGVVFGVGTNVRPRDNVLCACFVKGLLERLIILLFWMLFLFALILHVSKQDFYFSVMRECRPSLCQPRTQGSIYAPGAVPLRKNPGPGWSRASQNMGSDIYLTREGWLVFRVQKYCISTCEILTLSRRTFW